MSIHGLNLFGLGFIFAAIILAVIACIHEEYQLRKRRELFEHAIDAYRKKTNTTAFIRAYEDPNQAYFDGYLQDIYLHPERMECDDSCEESR